MNPNEVDLAAAIRKLDSSRAKYELEMSILCAQLEFQVGRLTRFIEVILAKYPGYDAPRQAEVPR